MIGDSSLMRLKSYVYYFFLSLLTLLWVMGCTPQLPFPEAPTELMVSSAIALTEPLEALKPLYEKRHPNVSITYNFGASGDLRQQIEHGAAVDVFISASQKEMNDLADQDLIIPDTRTNFAKNRIVLVVPKVGNFANIVQSTQDLTKPEIQRIAIGDPATVPMGRYSEEIFQSLDLLEQLQPKLVFGQNIRQVLSYVETGNVDAGLVWVTDANTTDQVITVEMIPEELHSPAIYPAAVIERTLHLDAATTYVEFLHSEDAQTILDNYGFIPID